MQFFCEDILVLKIFIKQFFKNILTKNYFKIKYKINLITF